MAQCDFPKCDSKAVSGYKEDVTGFVTCWCEPHEDISKHVILLAGRYLTDDELDASSC
jgi:hypothetical protein